MGQAQGLTRVSYPASYSKCQWRLPTTDNGRVQSWKTSKRENIEWLVGHSKHREQPLHIREGAKQIGGRAGLSKWLGTRVYGNGWEWPEMKLESWFQPDTKGLECYAKEFCRPHYHSVRSTSWNYTTRCLPIPLLPPHAFSVGLICSQTVWKARFSITGITAVDALPISYWTRGLGSHTMWRATPHR